MKNNIHSLIVNPVAFIWLIALLITGCCGQKMTLFFSGPPTITLNHIQSDCFYIESAYDSCLVLSIEESGAANAPVGAKVVWKAKNGSNAQLWKGNFTYLMGSENESGNRKTFSLISAVKQDMIVGIGGSGTGLKLTLQNRKAGNDQAWTVMASCTEKDRWILSPFNENNLAMLVDADKASNCETHEPIFGNYSQINRSNPERMHVRIKKANCDQPPLPANARHNITAGQGYKIRSQLPQGSDMLVRVKNDQPSAGQKIILARPQRSTGEYWRASDAGNGYFYFESLLDQGKVLECKKAKNDEAEVVLATKSKSSRQMWKPKQIERKEWKDQQTQALLIYIILINKENGLTLTVETYKSPDGSKMLATKFKGAGAQRFTLEPVRAAEEKAQTTPMESDYCYTISHSMAISGFMEKPDLGKAGMSLLVNNGDDRTKWQFIPVEGDWGLLTCVNMGTEWFATANYLDWEAEGTIPVSLTKCRFHDGFKSTEANKQLWRIKRAPNNRSRFENKAMKGKFISPGNDSGADDSGRRLYLMSTNQSAKTGWILRKQEKRSVVMSEDINCPPPPKQSVTLKSLKCIKKQEIGTDEIFLRVSVDGKKAVKYPAKGKTKMKKGNTWDVNLTWEFEDILKIAVYEQDGEGFTLYGESDNPDDLVGEVLFSADKQEGAFQMDFNQNGHYKGTLFKKAPDGSVKQAKKLTIQKFEATEFDAGGYWAGPWKIYMQVHSDIPGQKSTQAEDHAYLKVGDTWELNQTFAFYDTLSVQFLHILNEHNDPDTLFLTSIHINKGSGWPTGPYHRGGTTIHYHHYPTAPSMSQSLNNAFGGGSKNSSPQLERIKVVLSEFHSWYYLENPGLKAGSDRLPTLKITNVKCIHPTNAINVNKFTCARDQLRDLGGAGEDYWDAAMLTGSLIADLALYLNKKYPGADELYLMADGQKTWPTNKEYHKINRNEKVSPNHELKGWHRGRTIDMWESDSGDDDYLGSFSVDPALGVEKRTKTILSRIKGSVYEITYEIVE